MQVFQMADKIGIKSDLLDVLKNIMNEYKGIPTYKRKFGAEELHYTLYMGMVKAGVKDNFEFTSWNVLAKTYLYGFLIGKLLEEKK